MPQPGWQGLVDGLPLAVDAERPYPRRPSAGWPGPGAVVAGDGQTLRRRAIPMEGQAVVHQPRRRLAETCAVRMPAGDCGVGAYLAAAGCRPGHSCQASTIVIACTAKMRATTPGQPDDFQTGPGAAAPTLPPMLYIIT